MTAFFIVRRLVAFLGVVAFGAAGCSTPETHHYTLAPVSLPAVLGVTGGPAITVGVGPVRLPDYVDRPEIVVRISDYKVDLLTFDHWAAPLDQQFPKVLTATMQSQMPFARVIGFPPLQPTPVDVQVEVEVQQFDVDVAGTAVLIANWQMRGPQGQRVLTSGQAQVMANAVENTMPGRVGALSEAVAKLSRVLSDAVLALPPTGGLAPALSQPVTGR